jgi:hypothetical protein
LRRERGGLAAVAAAKHLDTDAYNVT